MDRETRAVVTGAGSGLGRALAKALAARGARVVVSDLREDVARATVAEIAAAGGTSHAVVCDVTQAAEVERLAAEAARLIGPVDLVVNNAGIGAAGHVGEVSLEAWRQTIDVNLWGVIHGCHYFVPAMRARRAVGLDDQRHGHVRVDDRGAGDPRWRPTCRLPALGVELDEPRPGGVATRRCSRSSCTPPSVR